ncbi:hypothetical protein BDV98DRAFT_297013 [Pterulicium gracile]|uniref:Secreted protein n=1 Tax=Pterulicium gracile TaxID=1884261 RepID=A0A5C3Q785_9AGAR|nr:hypothetical protein BDV98DRAFT_297013 [Pterula gracilis]
MHHTEKFIAALLSLTLVLSAVRYRCLSRACARDLELRQLPPVASANETLVACRRTIAGGWGTPSSSNNVACRVVSFELLVFLSHSLICVLESGSGLRSRCGSWAEMDVWDLGGRLVVNV